MSNEITLSSGASTNSLVVMPKTFAEVLQFADIMSKSVFVPKHLRGKPADCVAVCLQAIRWEADPFAVAQKTYFVSEGSAPGYEAQLVNAIVNSRAPIERRLDIVWSGAGNNLTCTVTGTFRGDPKPKVKTCHFATITTKNSPSWKQDPEQQLGYYTTRAWARLYCPEVIMGIYTPDEVESFVGPDDARDITPPPPRPRLQDFAPIDEDARAAGIIAQHKAQLGETDDDPEETESDPVSPPAAVPQAAVAGPAAKAHPPASQPAGVPKQSLPLIDPDTGEVIERFPATHAGALGWVQGLRVILEADESNVARFRLWHDTNKMTLNRLQAAYGKVKADHAEKIMGEISAINDALANLPDDDANPFG